ncbi:hypothetical protein B0T26DRAFT_757183 [Lasiosphaeria miniovina]|uniref:Uncharacterized protein n=1 Tax=Lasiosphaeria miniovina TaxID=1954250 RepID=A0AA39ZU90_9PEZI|nr:uncharacterized protein B0T26DRAFT_757183 [Lasiosphaeria miniovina]KAK0703665.1 hypothetical protein B0T26DRAFT_757183 [Lasiosphaeria miniovina]
MVSARVLVLSNYLPPEPHTPYIAGLFPKLYDYLSAHRLSLHLLSQGAEPIRDGPDNSLESYLGFFCPDNEALCQRLLDHEEADARELVAYLVSRYPGSQFLEYRRFDTVAERASRWREKTIPASLPWPTPTPTTAGEAAAGEKERLRHAEGEDEVGPSEKY